MPVDKVVYVLGAGFSAPLGIPVMSNFLEKSKDMYFADPTRYGYFEKVLDRIRRMSVVKNYYAADLFNIEEILSISEMSSFVNEAHFREEFVEYIRAVVAHYTPPVTDYEGNLPSNWEGFAFGSDRRWNWYGYFVTNLCNVKLVKEESSKGLAYVCVSNDDKKAEYSVVSLNYDLVLEHLCTYVNSHFRMDAGLGFCRQVQGDGPTLAKLHGSLEGGALVPPTWSKGSHPEIAPVWRRALEELRSANHIRFIGYSLPSADAYVRYLLKAAVLDAPHLKRIDVICSDPGGTVRANYDSFISFTNYRFVSGRTEDYLKHLFDLTTGHANRSGHRWRRLEKAHEEFVAGRDGARG